MFKKIVIINVVVILAFISTQCFGDIVVLNDNVIGKNIEDNVPLMKRHKDDNVVNIAPVRIDSYIEDLKYTGVVLFYPINNGRFYLIESFLNTIYPDGRNAELSTDRFIVWRINEKKMSIILTEEPACVDGSKEAQIYITYQQYK